MIRKNFFISLIVALILLTGIDTWAAVTIGTISVASKGTTSITLQITNPAIDVDGEQVEEYGYIIKEAGTPDITGLDYDQIITIASPALNADVLAVANQTFSSLQANTLYHVLFYVIHDGVTDVYSTEITPITLPAATTNAASSITGGNATLNGQISTGGGEDYTDRGFVYSLTNVNADPLVSGIGVTKTQVAGTNDFGAYTLTLTDIATLDAYYFKSYVTNDGTNYSYGALQTFGIGAATVPVLAATTAANTLTAQTANSGYDVTDAGGSAITESGVVWDVNTTPTVALSTKTTQGATTAAASAVVSNLTGLLGNTLYYVRSYATNSTGTGYGSQITFTTEGPDVTSQAASGVTAGNATLNGTVVGDGGAAITARGFVYSLTGTNANPLLGGTGVTNVVEGGTAVSSFSSARTDLTAATGYSYRAYATTSEGTSYGAVTTFTTSAAAVPTLAATTAANTITGTSASSGYDVTDAGGSSITQSGIVWGTSSNPTVALTTKTTQGAVTAAAAAATSNLTSLSPGTTYYVRAYATNSSGTGYGSEVSFATTSAAPSIQSKLISWTGLTTTTINLKVVKGNGARRIIVIKPSTAIAATPTDATDYDADANFGGTGSPFDGTGRVVYDGTGTTVSVTGLTAGTTYYVQAFEYNGTGGGTLYNTGTNTNNPRSFLTVSNTPGNPSTLALTAVAETSFDVSWSAASNAQGYYAFLAKDAAFTDYSSPVAAYEKLDIGLTTSFAFDELTQNSSYYWQLSAYNTSGSTTPVKYTANNADGRVAPLANEPTLSGLALTASIPAHETTNSTEMYLTWSGGALNGTGTLKYLVIGTQAAFNDAVPTDGVVYAGNTIYGTGNSFGGSEVIYDGTATSATVTGLTANTQYTFKVFAYQTNGFDNGGTVYSDRNYEPTGATATRYTIAAEQATSPTVPAYATLLENGTGYTLSWTAATTVDNAHYVVVAKSGSAPTSLPVDGTYPVPTLNGDFTGGGTNVTLTDGTIIYAGTGTSVAVTNLTAATDYHFAIYAANVGSNGTTTVNYRTGSPLATNRYTLKAAVADGTPSISVRNAATETVSTTDKGINIAFTPGAGIDSVLVVIARDGTVPTAPVDGTTYTAPAYSKVGNNYTVTMANINASGSDGETGVNHKVVYSGAATAENILITGLTANEHYQIAVTQYMRTVNTTNNYNTPSVTDIYSISTTPAAQISALSASAFTTNSITAAWTNAGASGSYTLVSAKAGAGITNHPVDGTAYTGSLDFSSPGDNLGNSTYVIRSANAGTSGVITNLSPSTLYTINAYSMNDDGNGLVLGQQYNYKITSPQSIQRFTLATAQTDAPDAIAFSAASTTSLSLVLTGATAETNTNVRYLVVAKSGASAITTDPVDGVLNYTGTANSASPASWTGISQLYEPGGVTEPSSKVIYDGAAGTVQVTDLTPGTAYSFTVWSYATGTGTGSALTLPLSGATDGNNDKAFHATQVAATGYTLVNEPTQAATAIASVTADVTTQIDLSWTAGTVGTAPGGTLKHLVVAKPTAEVAGTDPVDGTDYTGTAAALYAANDNLGNDNQIVKASTGTTVSVTGLTANTEYSFRVYAYGQDTPLSATTANYNTTSAPTVTRYTLATAPDAPTGPTFTSLSNNGTAKLMTVNWVNAVGGNTPDGTLVLATFDGSAPAAPTDGASTYAAVTGTVDVTTAQTLSGTTKILYNGATTTSSAALTNLTAGSLVRVAVYHYRGGRTTGAANFGTAASAQRYFLSDPVVSANVAVLNAPTFNLTAGDATLGRLNYSWSAGGTAPNTIGYLLVTRDGANLSTHPTEGLEYAESSVYTTATGTAPLGSGAVVYDGNATSTNVTALTDGTIQAATLYTYNWDGVNNETKNYFGGGGNSYFIVEGTGSVTGMYYTPAIESTTSVTSAAATVPTQSGHTLNWTVGTAASNDYTVVLASTTAADTPPTDGVIYTVGQTLGNATVVYAGEDATAITSGLTAATSYIYSFYSGNYIANTKTINYKQSAPATVTAYTLAQDITAEATALTVDQLAVGQYRLNWTAGTVPSGGNIGYVVVARVGTDAGTTAPADGTNYNNAGNTDPDDATPGGAVLGNGEVVYNSNATNVTLTGLTDATKYTFKVYAFNWNGSNVETRNYGSGSTAFTRISINSTPVAQATAAVATRTATSLGLTYTYANGAASPDNTLLTITPTGSAATDPSIGTYYTGLKTTPVALTSGTAIGLSTVISSTGFMDEKNDGPGGTVNTYPTAVTVTGLTANTEYTVRAYAANITNNDISNTNTDANYKATPGTATAWTLATAPDAPTAPVFSSFGTTGYTLSWTASATAGVDGYVVLARATTATATGGANEPTGGTAVTDPGDLVFGSDAMGSNEVMYVGAGTSIAITGLTANTQYHFAIYAYENGSDATTINYSSALTASRYTLDAEPTFAPVLSSAVKGTDNIQFTAASGGGTADKVIVYALKSNSSPATTPTTTPPSDGTAGTVVAGSTVLTTGTGVLVYDGAFGTVTVSNLDNGTYYSFVAYAYNENGTNTESNNYFGTASAVLSTNTLTTQPTTAAGNPTITSKTATTANFTVTNGDGAASLVSNQALASDGLGVVATPVDGTDYTANVAFGSGDLLGGTTVRVKKIGSATTGSLSGLSAATQYILRSYSYNGTATGLANFKVDTYGETTFRTLATAPTSAPGTISYTAATHNSAGPTSGYTVSWTAASGATGTTKYLVIGKATSSSNFSPTNGTAYTTMSDLSGDGTVYYVGTDLTTGAITGLTPNTTYNWRIFAYDDLGFAGSENYFGTASTSNQVTIPADPHVFTNAAALTKTSVSDQSIDLSWTAATATEANTQTPTGYIVIARQGSAVTANPTDGVNASADNFFSGGTDLGTNEYVVYKGTGTSVSVTGLNSGTTYHFKVLSYTQGTPAYSANFSYNSAVTGDNVNNLTANFSTLATAPGSSPSGMAVSARTNSSITTTWTSGASAANTIVLQKASTALVSVTDEPVNGTGYTAPVAIGAATAIQSMAQTNTYAFTSLSADSKYFFRAYDYNGTGATSNYGTSGSNYAGTFGYTLATEPTAQVAITTTGATQNGTSLVIPYTFAGSLSSSDSIIVLVKTSNITTAPTDGNRYTTASTIDGASVNTTLIAAASGNITLSGLTQNTSYTIAAFPYRGTYYTDDATSTVNFLSTLDGVNRITLSTIATEPSTAPSAVLVPNAQRTNNGHRVTWTAGNGTNTLVLGSTNSSAPTIADGATYAAANLTFASATDATGNAGYKVLHNGANTNQIDIVLPTQSATQYYYYIYDYNGSGGSENYTATAATGNHYTLETAPTGASTGLTVGSTNAGGTIDLAVTTADDNARTLIASTSDGSAPTAPTNGVFYINTIDGSTNVVTKILAGATDAKTYSVTGLTPGTTYKFNAYAYTGNAVSGTTPDAGTEGTTNYAAGAGVLTVTARSAEPAAQATSLTATTVGATTATLSWTAASGGATRYLVVVADNADVINAAPVDGTKYAAAVTYAGPLNETNPFGSGFTSTHFTGLGNATVVYNGTGTSVAIPSGLSSGSTYKAAVFAFNEAGVNSENYVATINTLNAGSSNYISFQTLNTEPTISTSALVATPAGTSISIAYTAGNGANRLVVYKTGATTPTFVPVDGNDYTNGSEPVSGEFVINTASTPVVLTGLTSSTQYSYAFYEYNGSGVSRNYKQSSPATGDATTTSAPVLTSLAFTSGTATTYSTANSTIVVELRDASNAVYTETASRAISLSFSYGSNTMSMGTMNTVVGQTTVTFNNINFSNTITGTNGTLVGNIWAEATGITRARHGVDNISVVAAEPTTTPTLTASKSAPNTLTVEVSYNSSVNSGYLLYHRMTNAVGATTETDGTVATTSAITNSTVTAVPYYIGTVVTQVVSGLTASRNHHFKAVPYKGGLNATINYGQAVAGITNRYLSKQANYDSEFDENAPNEGGFEISELEQNPVTDKVTFNLHSYSNQVYNVEIISNTGERVATGLVNAGFGRGKHLVRIPLSENIASGTYYITVTSGGEMIAKPFVIVK